MESATAVGEAKPIWTSKIDGDGGECLFSRDGSVIALYTSVSANTELGYAQLVRTEDGTKLVNYQTRRLNSVSVSDDGNYFVVSGYDGVLLFSRLSDQPLWNYEGTNGESDAQISDDGNFIASRTSNAWDLSWLSFFERSSGEPVWELRLATVLNREVAIERLVMSKDARHIAVSTSWYSKEIFMLDPSSKSIVWQYTTEEEIDELRFSHDGNYLVGWGIGGPLYLFNVQSREPIWTYEESIRDAEISDDGAFVLVLQSQGPTDQVRLLSRDSATPIRMWTEPVFVDSVSLAGNGLYAAGFRRAGEKEGDPSRDGVAFFLDTRTQNPVWTSILKERTVVSWDEHRVISLSPDGESIAVIAAYEQGQLYLLYFNTRNYQRASNSETVAGYVLDEMTALVVTTVAVIIGVLLVGFRLRRTHRKGLASGIQGFKQCTNCQCRLPREAKFCDACGTKQAER